MRQVGRILIVEDNANDLELAMEALDSHKLVNEVVAVRDGSQALDYLYRRGTYIDRPGGDPAVVLLDIKMPKISGLEVLEKIKSDPNLRRIPIVMLSSSREEPDLTKAYDLGANSYVVKPVDFQQFIVAVEQIGCFWALLNVTPPEDSSSPSTDDVPE